MGWRLTAADQLVDATACLRGAAPLAAALVAALTAPPLPAAQPIPAELENVGVSEKINQQVDLGLTFLDESARPVALADYFHPNRPVVLNLVYYTCPMLCNLVLKGLTKSLSGLPWTPGQEFEVVTVTINPAETPQLAREKKQAYLASYGRPAPGWHFLTDHQGNVKRLAGQLGFNYAYNDARGRVRPHGRAVHLDASGESLALPLRHRA